MKCSPSPRTILAHLLPETSTQSLLLFYLAILKLQPRPTKTSRQGRRPSQRRSTSETPASMAVVLRGRRPWCISGPLYFRSQRMPTKVQSPFLSLFALSISLRQCAGWSSSQQPKHIPANTHTHTRSEQGGSFSKQGNNPKHHSTHNRTHLNITRLEYHTPKTSSTEPKIPNFIKHHKIIEDPHKNQ
jgi:hypothetical protein